MPQADLSPARAGSAGRGALDPALASGVNTRPRILIVEDEAVIALDLAQHLQDFGYAVVGIAASAERAMELAMHERPSLIMMDIVIKGPLDGVETARSICAQIDVPVIFLTAYGDAATLERVKQVSPHGHLLKPFRPSDLHTSIEVALQQHRLARQLRESERWLFSTLQGLADGVIATDEHGRVRFMNPVAERLVGRRHSDAQQVPVQEIFVLHDGDAGTHRPDPTARALASGLPTELETGVVCGCSGDAPMPVEVRASPICDADRRLLGAVLVFRDISERRRSEAALARLAHLDSLTGLPNRAALRPQLEAMAASASRDGKTLAVMFIDLDEFKRVNDTLGHHAGDELLMQVARRLRETLRIEDYIARLGGDEFVVLAGGLAQAEMSGMVASKLIEAIRRPYVIDGHEVEATVSIGISLCPHDSADATHLLRDADRAMYLAKQRGKNQFALYSDAARRRAPERREPGVAQRVAAGGETVRTGSP